ncbi:MAG: EamA family transporter [Deltaproteobacteria bacterium]|nr:EamA family transporter [Deltaproteobacteria bacterium]MBW2448338.1 EamA family transporter [Deltaproteobacteria bacterium]
MRRPLEDWILLGILVAVWGTGFLFIATAVETLPPLTVAASRIVLAAVVLVAAVYASGRRLPRGRIWLWFLALGIVGNCLPFFAIGWGQQRIPSGLAGILMGVMPLATLVLAHFFVPGEDMTRGKTLGFLFGFAGVAVLTGPEALLEIGGAPSDLLRQLAILFGALCYATNAILTRHLPPTHALVASAATLGVAALVIGPVAAFVERPWSIEASRESWLAVVWLGLVTTAGATIVYFRLVASAGPTFFSYINFVIPIVALLAGAALLGEQVRGSAVAALVLVLGGLALSRRHS